MVVELRVNLCGDTLLWTHGLSYSSKVPRDETTGFDRISFKQFKHYLFIESIEFKGLTALHMKWRILVHRRVPMWTRANQIAFSVAKLHFAQSQASAGAQWKGLV